MTRVRLHSSQGLEKRIEKLAPQLSFIVLAGYVGFFVFVETANQLENFLGRGHVFLDISSRWFGPSAVYDDPRLKTAGRLNVKGHHPGHACAPTKTQMTEREAWNRCRYLEGDPRGHISSAPITRNVPSPSGFATPGFAPRDDPAMMWVSYGRSTSTASVSE
jgi:hypothetical protein